MIYLDTTFIVSLFMNTEVNHEKSVQIWNDNPDEEKIISNVVLSETITLLKIKLKGNTSAIIEIFESIMDTCKMIYEDKQLTIESFKVFVKYDSTISLTDALSVAIMQKLKIIDIASWDNDFNKIDGVVKLR